LELPHLTRQNATKMSRRRVKKRRAAPAPAVAALPVEPLADLNLSASWDQHVENTRDAIATLDRRAVESVSLATRIIITNAR
jgi:hypothetical protein